jgi:hypothetical protein
MRARTLFLAAVMLAACERKSAHMSFSPDALRVVLASEAELHKLGPAADDLVRRPWVGPIVQVLAEETPDNVTHLRRNRIAGSGTPPDALFERGLANLRKVSSPQSLQDRTVRMAKADVQITRFADLHTAGRLLLPELWSKVATTSGGRLYAAAPARDIVVWTTSAAESDQAALRGQARVAFQSRSEPISPAILRWTGDGWQLEDANPIQ